MTNLIKEELKNIVKKLSKDYSEIILRKDLLKYRAKKYNSLNWGQNGIGDRWCKKIYNYSVIYHNLSYKTYSDNLNDKVSDEILDKIKELDKNKGIIGIFVHSEKTNKTNNRPIKNTILKKIKNSNCTICGSNNEIVCDHKNDLYNDKRVLNIKTQILDDFQSLCNHCNLQKRQICKNEKLNNKLYSAKNIPIYKISYDFNFPWEYKSYDINDIDCKKDTYWYDPIEFHNKIQKYQKYIIPIINEIKKLNN